MWLQDCGIKETSTLKIRSLFIDRAQTYNKCSSEPNFPNEKELLEARRLGQTLLAGSQASALISGWFEIKVCTASVYLFLIIPQYAQEYAVKQGLGGA